MLCVGSVVLCWFSCFVSVQLFCGEALKPCLAAQSHSTSLDPSKPAAHLQSQYLLFPIDSVRSAANSHFFVQNAPLLQHTHTHMHKFTHAQIHTLPPITITTENHTLQCSAKHASILTVVGPCYPRHALGGLLVGGELDLRLTE